MIGVIASLTLPTLMNSTNDKEVVAKVKKSRAMLNEALGRAAAKYGNVDTWCAGCTEEQRAEKIGKRVTEFMQVEKVCGTTGTGCFASGNFKYHHGATGSRDFDGSTNNYNVILADGTAVSFDGQLDKLKNEETEEIDETDTVVRSTVWVDIDGPKKGKHTIGVDLFSFQIIDSKNAISRVPSDTDLGVGCRTSKSTRFCTEWVLNYDNVDYLHCAVTEANPTCN